jgi:DedD protein
MNSLYETEEREERQEAELTLGTGTLLAIFFGLVVVCAVFFGFGYSMGRRSAESKAATLAATSPAVDAAAAAAAHPKPSAVEVLRTQVDEPATTDDTAPRTVVVDQPAARDAEAPAPATATPERPAVVKTPLKPVATTVAATSARVPPAPTRVTPPSPTQTAKPAASAVTAAPAATMVQIAAVSHPEDAEALLAALKKRGYTVVVRNEPQDKLFHVQIGPFANRADANAMRQKLLADGYNAILK